MAMTPDEAGYVQALEAKVRELEAEIAKLQVKLKDLYKVKGLSSASEGLTYNKRTGLSLEASTGIHYCPKGLAKNERHPLAEENEWGWRCHICDHFYPNPDAEPPAMTVESTPF